MKNIHSSDGMAEDLIRSFTQIANAELHVKTLLEKRISELENGMVKEILQLQVGKTSCCTQCQARVKHGACHISVFKSTPESVFSRLYIGPVGQ